MDILESLLNDDLHVRYTGKGSPMYLTEPSFEIRSLHYPLTIVDDKGNELIVKMNCTDCFKQGKKQRITNDSPVIRYIKDTDKYGKVITIKITRHRKRCMNCRKSFFYDRIDYLNSKSMFSKDYKKAVINYVLDTEATLSMVSKEYYTSINTVKSFLKKCTEINNLERIKIYNTPVINIFPFEYRNKTACCISGFTKVDSVYKNGILGILQDYSKSSIKEYLSVNTSEESNIKLVICRLNTEVIEAAKEELPNAKIIINHNGFLNDLNRMMECEGYNFSYLSNSLIESCKSYEKELKGKFHISTRKKEKENYEQKSWEDALDGWVQNQLTEKNENPKKEILEKVINTFKPLKKEILDCIKREHKEEFPVDLEGVLPEELRYNEIFHYSTIRDLLKRFAKRGYKHQIKNFSFFALRLLFLNPAVKDVAFKSCESELTSMALKTSDKNQPEILHGYYVDIEELKYVISDPMAMTLQSQKYYRDYLEKRDRLIYPE